MPRSASLRGRSGPGLAAGPGVDSGRGPAASPRRAEVSSKMLQYSSLRLDVLI